MKKVKQIKKNSLNLELHFLINCGIKIYPIGEIEFYRRSNSSKGSQNNFLIEINNNGKIKTFEKRIKSNEIDEALEKTIIFYYQKIKEDEKTNNK